MQIRQATSADAAELVRLRAVMLRTFATGTWNDDWCEPARVTLTRRLAEAEPTMAAFVADRPDGTGLAAGVLGTIEQRLGGPGNPDGRAGYVFSVVTEAEHRRQGYSRACMTALINWFRERGVGVVDLRASVEGEPLYRSLGFERTKDPAMRLRLRTA